MHLAINGISQSVDDSAKQLKTDWDVNNSSSTFHDVALLDQLVITKYYNTDIVWLQVQCHALNSHHTMFCQSNGEKKQISRD